MILLAIYKSAYNTVLERKRELGMLRANGESATDLILLLSLEGLFLALTGTFLGMIMTLAAQALTNNGIPMPPPPGTNRLLPVKLNLEIIYFITAASLGLVTSIAATLLSTRQVLRLSSVKTIRSAA